MLKKLAITTTLLTSSMIVLDNHTAFANENNTVSSRQTILKGKVINVKSNDTLNVRESSNSSSKILFTLKNGEIVTVLNKESNGWYKIQKDSQTGYVNGVYLSTYTETTSSPNYTTVTTTDAVNLRKTMSWSASEVIMTIPKGSSVSLVSKGSDWSEVLYKNTKGYVPTSYISTNASQDKPSTDSSSGNSNTLPSGVTESNLNAQGKVIKIASNDVLNVRKSPNGDSSKVTTLKLNQVVTITKKTSNNWYKISVNNTEGYVNGAYIELVNQNITPQGEKATTNNIVNLRDSKSWSSTSVILQIPKNATIYILEKGSEWSKITYNNKTGYIPTSYITSQSNTENNPTVKPPITSDKVGKIGTVNTSNLNIRSGAGMSYSVISKVYSGDIILIKEVSSNGDWYKVETTTGVVGWCGSSYIKDIRDGKLPSYGLSSSEKVNNVLKVAKEQLGKPYVFGSTGPDSFDCSGLAYYVFKNGAGITLPRNSKDQATVGTYVAKSDLKPGDLVFFNTSGSGISHLGIYIGNNEMIHAPRSGKNVEIVKITDSYWANRYVTARRVIND